MSVGNKITNVILSHSGQVLTNTWGQCRCSKMQLLQNTANTDSISQIMQDWFCLRFHFLLQPVGGKKIPINEQTLRCDVFTRERLATKHGWFRQECWFLNRIDLPAVSDGSWKWCAVMCVREDKGMHCFVDNSDLYTQGYPVENHVWGEIVWTGGTKPWEKFFFQGNWPGFAWFVRCEARSYCECEDMKTSKTVPVTLSNIWNLLVAMLLHNALSQFPKTLVP